MNYLAPFHRMGPSFVPNSCRLFVLGLLKLRYAFLRLGTREAGEAI